jgi:hypothetical protein
VRIIRLEEKVQKILKMEGPEPFHIAWNEENVSFFLLLFKTALKQPSLLAFGDGAGALYIYNQATQKISKQ